ncbi:succinylglutamate desuccinylase/aspartoacylase family protein [Streptomyces sp. G44]|uniref:M14 family zinc carboxypeptidase n=1 Tax=Streptomyces sp. G44 TaxID=2807632 RepID=UPI00195F8EE6|nr:M14 family zinc carboxypeptidase [Streptomyces sp. G44]MBM7167430.1 succinylglutamate desuccinylase/aspartoacylase family protein [Streptomyces sp. G44]
MGLSRPSRPVLLTTAATAGALVLTALAPGSATADPTPRPVTREGSPLGSGRAAKAPEAAAERALGSSLAPGLTDDRGRGYPRERKLPAPPENPADKSIKLGLTPYHGIAPKLNELQRVGDRVSVEIAGRSAGGHPLYLVTVTAPESARETARQERMRERIENHPASAAKDKTIKASYKTPVFINNNIHGNEWEGTDAALKLIEKLARAKDRKSRSLLAHNRLYFSVTTNPDGRIAGTRANANGFDLNRDFITASQPEARAVRAIAVAKQPAVMIDLHGYVNGTLIEPTTPPHGENYEYDLFLKNSYANALGMEAAVNGLGYTEEKDGVKPAVIPFRDQEEGWDDWPPVFTPQYMPFHGAVATHTIEFPMQVNNAAYESQPVTELRRRARVNVDIAGAAMRASIAYADRHRGTLIADQIEVFRRGATGAKQVPVSEETVPGVPGIGPEDVYTTEFPRAYVIPGGRGQRSATAAARLVDHLIANDVRVERARHGFRLGGRTYPKGSYVVDMHQPKRGLANVMLADGRDISGKVSTMYDISGWSLGRLWGAGVDTVQAAKKGELERLRTRQVRAAAGAGYVAPRGDLRLRLDDPREIAALNSLLADGVRVRRDRDGGAIVPSSARRAATTAAKKYDVAFDATKAGSRKDGAVLRRTRVAAAVTPGELFALREMDFDVVPVSTAVLNAGFDWQRTDALFVSAGLDHAKLTKAAKAGLDRFLTRGGGLVGRGAAGAALNTATELLAARAVEGNGDANGVVRVANAGGPLTGGAPAHSFVYSPMWFTGLGSGVRVEQRYGVGNPLVSGHWRAMEDGTGGPADAAGRAAVVSGSARGADVVLFGTEPLFRDHPKGLFPQVGRALLSVGRR